MVTIYNIAPNRVGESVYFVVGRETRGKAALTN